MGFETVYVGFETVCPEKDKQMAFYSPLETRNLDGPNAEGYKRPIDKNWGPISKNRVSGRNPDFWANTKQALCTAKFLKEKSTDFPNKYQSFS